MRKALFSLILLAGSLVLLTGCLAIGNPEVRNISTKDLAQAPTALTQYIKEYQIPASWIAGVIVQQRWQHSYGWDSDPHNNVKLRVYVPNKLIVVIPCGPRQEKGFVEDYAPGDIVALSWNGTSREGAPQDTAYLCKDDVILMKKGGALNIGATQ